MLLQGPSPVLHFSLRRSPPRTLFGDHYYFSRARLQQICVGADSLFLVTGTKKSWPEVWILAEINFSGASKFFPDPSFGPPGNEIRGPKLSANCPQIVRKLSANARNSPNRDSISCEFERLKNELKNGSFQAGNRVFFAVFCRARKTAVF